MAFFASKKENPVASTFIEQTKVADTALALLQREIVLPALVTAVPFQDFRGAANDTVSIRVPARATAREYGWRNDRSATIVTDDLTETKVDVTLSKDPYNAIALTDEQLTLDIVDFGTQVLTPQMRSIAEKLETYIAAVMAAAPIDVTVSFGDSGLTALQALIKARQALNKANVPFADRVFVMGADVEAAFLMLDQILKVNESGSDSALRDASLGQILGFKLVTSNAIDPDTAYAFHPTAFVLATGAPIVPAGATFGATSEVAGLSMRWLRDYDAPHLQDRSVVSAFAGTAYVADGATDDDITPGDDATGTVVRAVKVLYTGTADKESL